MTIFVVVGCLSFDDDDDDWQESGKWKLKVNKRNEWWMLTESFSPLLHTAEWSEEESMAACCKDIFSIKKITPHSTYRFYKKD